MADRGGASLDRAHLMRDRRADLVLLVASVIVVLPILWTAARQVRADWAPVNDDAVIYTRTLDVLSADPPLVGQYTLASEGEDASAAAYSPGPLGYQLLAVPARVLPAWTIPAVVGIISSACFVGVLVLARRRGGIGLVLATALGLLAVQRSLELLTFVEIWNPHLAMAPFVLLLVVCWSIAAGDRWLLPAAAFLASLAAQLHLTYVAPGLAALAIAVVGGWAPDLMARWRRRDPNRPPEPELVAPRYPSRFAAVTARPWAPIAAAALVGLLCWAAPLYQQVTGSPGNLGQILSSNGGGDRDQFGAGLANAALVDTYGVPPSFLVRDPELRLFLPGGTDDPLLAQVVALGVVVGVAAVAVGHARRRERSVVAGASVALALVPALWTIVAIFPVDRALAASYSFRWFVPAGLLAWLVLGWGVARLDRVPRPGASAGDAATVAVLVVGLVAAVVIAMQPYAPQDQLHSTYAAANALGDPLEAATRAGGRYRLAPSGIFRYSLEPAMAARLRADGRDPVIGDDRVMFWGDRYRASGVRCDGVVRVLGPGDTLPGGTVLATTSMLVGDEEVEARLAMAPDSLDGTC
ncbi:MAG: hypothetical protein KF906_12795 [Actinobacteria bacterium]|nr:hypothetical protein [Actinomycetota bacterium]